MANKRVFIIDNREFPDPDPKMSVEDVRQYYVAYFAELSNAETKQTTRPSAADPAVIEDVIEFKKRVGTKGGDPTTEQRVECPSCHSLVPYLGEFEHRPMCPNCVESELRLVMVQMEAKGYLQVTPTGVIITELGMRVWRQSEG